MLRLRACDDVIVDTYLATKDLPIDIRQFLGGATRSGHALPSHAAADFPLSRSVILADGRTVNVRIYHVISPTLDATVLCHD